MTGKIIQGHVFDCNRLYLERALHQYDPQLYLKWNPYKTLDEKTGKAYVMPPEGEHWRGWGKGCWELRRRPTGKTAVPKWQLGDTLFFDLEFVETDVIHHLKDFQYLTYDILAWVKANDTWSVKDWAADLEYREDKSYDRALDESQAELRYRIRHEKRAMRAFQDELKSGRSPLEFLSGTW